MKKPYFSTISKKKHQDLSKKGGLVNRTPEVQKAWDDSHKIRKLYSSGLYTHRKLAKKYHVSYATIARILNS